MGRKEFENSSYIEIAVLVASFFVILMLIFPLIYTPLSIVSSSINDKNEIYWQEELQDKLLVIDETIADIAEIIKERNINFTKDDIRNICNKLNELK